MLKQLGLYLNTIRYLKPVQIVGQVRKKLFGQTTIPTPTYNGVPNRRIKTMISALDLDNQYLMRFQVDDLLHNKMTLIGESFPIDMSNWAVGSASHLCNFNLHYFEYGIALAATYYNSGDKRYYEHFKTLVLAWISANPVGYGDGWNPYTISMRIPNLLICFDLFGSAFDIDTDFSNIVFQSIYVQYHVLLKRQETWQLGNHYFENLKTIVLCSILFGEESIYKKYISRFIKEMNEEVLPDGVHFELSIMYHKVILEDIIRVTYWLKQADMVEIQSLLPVMQNMVNALASLELGMGKTPLFNDAGDGIAKDSSSLLKSAVELFNISPMLSDSFPNSGYYKLYDGNIAVMFDVGKIGPDYMPGHGHCDCLSFEASINSKPVFVNSGTHQYQGDLRSYFRSTQAHNTLIIGDKQQSECWGEHRVARRVAEIYAEKSEQCIIGSYKSYCGDIHTRTISLTDGSLAVLDSVETKTADSVHSYLHIPTNCIVINVGKYIEISDKSGVICEVNPLKCDYLIHISDGLTNYAPAFGILEQATTIEFYWATDTKQHGYSINFHKEKEVYTHD